MNNSKKLPIIIAAVIAVVALIVGGIFFLNQDKSGDNIPVPNSSPKASASASAAPTETGITASSDPSVKPTDNASNEEKMKKFEETKSYKDASEVAGFSKQDIQDILRISNDYAYNSLTNGYYLSGQWEKDGMPNNLDATAGKFFTSDMRSKIKSIDTNPKTGKNIAKDVLPLTFFVGTENGVSPNEVCATSSDSKAQPKSGFSCPMDGLKFTDMTYTPTDNEGKSGVQVEFSATAKIPVKFNGDNAYSEVKYDYTLNFVNNEDYEATTNPNKFVINYFQVQSNMGALVKF